MSSKELKSKDEFFGIYFNYPTLLGLKMIKKFMEENGFSSPRISSYCIYYLEDSNGHFVENKGGLEESIEFYGPNLKIDSSATIFFKNDKEQYQIKFKTEMFGDRDTLRIIYEGDERCFAFIDKNFQKIYRISYSTTLNPFFTKKLRLSNIFGPLLARCLIFNRGLLL